MIKQCLLRLFFPKRYIPFTTRPYKLHHFNIDPPRFSSLKGRPYFQEKFYHYDPEVFKQDRSTYFDGYWASYRYFDNYRNDLLKIFTLKKGLSDQAKKYRDSILNNPHNTVSIHVRRGDYLHLQHFHSLCTMEYYKRAIEYMGKDRTNHFFIFSDDLEWIRDNFKFLKQFTVVSFHEAESDIYEMYLMSICQDHIIANSSFSWWGAWLNSSPHKRVVVPKKWFENDLNTADSIPDNWLRI